MTVADLAGMLPPAGKTNAVWLTRFQALSVGDFGEEAYRIFYVGAESTGGHGAEVLRRLDDLHRHDAAGTARSSTTRRTMTATGRVCGNTISVDVPVNGGFGIGLPVGNKLYNVTAFTFGRNDANDIYADVDASHSVRLRSRRPLGGDGLLSATRATSPARSRARSAPSSRAGAGPGTSASAWFRRAPRSAAVLPVIAARDLRGDPLLQQLRLAPCRARRCRRWRRLPLSPPRGRGRAARSARLSLDLTPSRSAACSSSVR